MMTKVTSAMRSKIAGLFAKRGVLPRSIGAACDLLNAQEAEIYKLRQRLKLAELDTARFSWLSLNVTAELHLGGENGNIHVVRWVRRYITCETFCGTDLRDAVDAAIVSDREKAQRGVGA
jgi:hypothetical protein